MSPKAREIKANVTLFRSVLFWVVFYKVQEQHEKDKDSKEPFLKSLLISYLNKSVDNEELHSGSKIISSLALVKIKIRRNNFTTQHRNPRVTETVKQFHLIYN